MPTTMLSEHFTLAEFTYSETASRQGLDNTPTPEIVENLELLADIMELVRTLCGDNPVTITSGYRSPSVNAAIGGSSTSAHMSGLACDFIIPLFGEPYDVCKIIEPLMDDWAIDQLIWEYGDWVHLGLCAPPAEPRCQCLTIDDAGTREGFA
jgi:zinc D-Ala-D-Ala carboxypeptidase